MIATLAPRRKFLILRIVDVSLAQPMADAEGRRGPSSARTFARPTDQTLSCKPHSRASGGRPSRATRAGSAGGRGIRRLVGFCGELGRHAVDIAATGVFCMLKADIFCGNR